MYTRDDPN